MRAPGRRSAFHARNAGAAVATGSWLLFTDADCVPTGRPARAARGPRAGRALRAGRRRGPGVGGAGGAARPLGKVAPRPDRLPSAHLGPRPAGTTANLLVRATRSRPSAASARCAPTPTSSSAGGSRSAAGSSSTGPGRWSPTATPSASAPSSARPPATAPGVAGCGPPTGRRSRRRRWSAALARGARRSAGLGAHPAPRARRVQARRRGRGGGQLVGLPVRRQPGAERA